MSAFWQALESGNQAALLLLMTGGVLVVLAALFIFSRIAKRVADARVRRIDEAGIGVEELQRMQKSGALTPDELKKVRAAMARQYLDREKELQSKSFGSGRPALEFLAAESERLEAELRNAPRPPSKAQPADTPPAPPATAVDAPRDGELAARLRPLENASDLELEELRNAGFLSDDDVESVRENRRW